eukprot:3934060-Rhodomonas_salina.4
MKRKVGVCEDAWLSRRGGRVGLSRDEGRGVERWRRDRQAGVMQEGGGRACGAMNTEGGTPGQLRSWVGGWEWVEERV